MTESLKGKVAVITGVGSGFGKATAELFAQLDQVDLVLIDYNPQALECTAENCRAAGSKVITLACDVTDPTTFECALERAHSKVVGSVTSPSSVLLREHSRTSAGLIF